MPNYCNYEMRIIGKKENVEKMVSYLQSDYYYEGIRDEKGAIVKYVLDIKKASRTVADKHFFRVFDAEVTDEEERDTDYVSMLAGDCAWSVGSCMFNGVGSYYNDWLNDWTSDKRKCDDFRGTHMVLATKELDLDVEIFSEEPGCGFMEHYIVRQGEIMKSDCVKYKEIYDEETGEYEKEGGLEWDYEI